MLALFFTFLHSSWDDFVPDYQYTHKITGPYSKPVHITGSDVYCYIHDCSFIDITDTQNQQGGGAIFLEANVQTVIETATFHNVSCVNGQNGGAINIYQGSNKIYIQSVCADQCKLPKSDQQTRGTFLFCSTDIQLWFHH